MKKYVIGNWKCNKDAEEARSWFSEFASRYRPVAGLTVIVAPSFICLQSLSQHVHALGLENVSLAAQDISPFPKGSYTGAVAADMVKGMVDYVIIGHSERMRYFHETSQDVASKMPRVPKNPGLPEIRSARSRMDEPTISAEMIMEMPMSPSSLPNDRGV